MAEDNCSPDGRCQVDINTTVGPKIMIATEGLHSSEIINTDCRSQDTFRTPAIISLLSDFGYNVSSCLILPSLCLPTLMTVSSN